mgnify:CR=1 FL=1
MPQGNRKGALILVLDGGQVDLRQGDPALALQGGHRVLAASHRNTAGGPCPRQRRAADVFGYVRPVLDRLDEGQRELYQGAYCGLCHAPR